MAISKIRKRHIKNCVENNIEQLKREVLREFSTENHHKSGRSGDHGKKFNVISTKILNFKNNIHDLNETGCFDNQEEQIFVIDEFVKYAKRLQLKGKSINHASR